MDLTRQRLLIQRQAIWHRKKDCLDGEPRWCLAEPKSKGGARVVEIPGPLVPFLVAHREKQNGSPNPLSLVFPSEDSTPLDPGDVRCRHFLPAMTVMGLTGIRQHDFRRTFIALHVEAGTHPKLVQERVRHSNIQLTMDVYGKVGGRWPSGRSRLRGSTPWRRMRCRSWSTLGQQGKPNIGKTARISLKDRRR